MSNLWEVGALPPGPDTVIAGETVHRIFWNGVAERGPRVLMREKDLGIWRSWTWTEAGTAVREFTMGLVALGVQPGETVSILANTRVEWLLADMAALSAGAVSNGIYPTDSAEQVQYLCEDSRTVVLVVEDDEQLDKALEARPQLPLLRRIVVMDMEGLRDLDDPGVIGLPALRDLGRQHDASHPGVFEQRLDARGPDDLAILIYTSGTTGRPKGAMHSHRGLVYTVRGYDRLGHTDWRDERMCFLPLCHVAERLGGAFLGIYSGSVLNFVENPDTVPENVREIAPTVFTAVPRIWEKFYSAVMIGVSESSRLQQLTYAWSIGVGRAIADAVIEGRPVTTAQKIKFRIARLLALDNVRKLIGIHRARWLLTGAAPISPELVRWYMSLGLPMLEVWGQTESCGASTWMPAERIRPGSIGTACPYNEVKLDPATGELLIRGPNVFMGYLNQPEKTAETIDAEGWLHTGDVGTLDGTGYFHITDRMKDIIITAGGKNVTPSEWENELKFSPYVTDAVLIGDKRPYLTALVMIDQENVERFAQEHDVPFSNYTSLTRAKEIQDLIWREIEKANAKFARVEQVKKFRLMETQLTAEDEELTPTMKLKRKLVQQKYAALIDGMYRD